ncbi:SEC-C metal-binding domain-containing protein [Pseudoalteromonas sp. Of11M-6]|uniref:SEC-C metal-binding domain-containing protein n=1 Tax=Pseudoalteromonas sp. Of11M-6 TaxID=2917754 RepID=UPI001EF6665E|nr:SEC-C metal-binding domain-containing protein [Pseudoalteromonas sp. Of11M-6]MCG7552105.1 SEC-C domain-containing protein [Pseudoalteromonas sp. Of11M-6]
MLKPTIKEDGITESERYLAKLSERTFLGLWSYPNVYTDEGFSKNNEGKELCDLLVVFDNKVIIFSDKDINFNVNIDINIAWKRWFKKSVIKSAAQLYGAESWIRKHPKRLYLDKKNQAQFPINISLNKLEVYLVAVTKNSILPAKNYFSKFGEGGSGTLLQVYSINENENLNHPFVIGDLNPEKTFIHILDEITLDLLLNELDTVSDFTRYLKEKESAIRSGFLLQVAGEEDLLAHYLQHPDKTELGAIPKLDGKYSEYSITIVEGGWEEYKSSYLASSLRKFKEKSLYWDQLITLLSEHILSSQVGLGADLPFEIHERAVNYLAAENRVSRKFLSEAFQDKFRTVPHDARSARLVFSPQYKDRLYVFLFFSMQDISCESEYRLSRRNAIEAYSLVAKYQNPQANHVIVIATEAQNSKTRSEDVFSVHYDEPLTYDEKVYAKKMMKEYNVLNYTKKLNSKHIDNSNRPYINMSPDIGRNSPCFCGSGKKYKKCCL